MPGTSGTEYQNTFTQPLIKALSSVGLNGTLNELLNDDRNDIGHLPKEDATEVRSWSTLTVVT